MASSRSGGPCLLNRLATLSVHYIPGGTRTLAHQYDRFGNRKELKLTDGSEELVHSFVFDKRDRLATATLPGNGGSAHTFGYLLNDDLATLLAPSGVSTAFAYEPNGPVREIEVTAGGAQALRLFYTHDEVLNVDTLAETVGGTSYVHGYEYDEVQRLIERTQTPSGLGLPASEAFGYDPAGNREDPGTPSAYDYDANNRITASPGSLTYTFDSDGNMLTRSDGASFTWDAISQLRGFSKSPTVASYLYDPFGRRLKKTVNGTTTWFLWDGDQLLAEYDGSGTRQVRYAYAGGFAPLQVAQGSSRATEAVYDVHTDHLDTPRLLTDASEQVVWRASYESFGKAALDPANTVSFNVRFPGQYFDAESGLHDNFFRTYDPNTGRYLEADPIGQAGGVNLYAYARNGPTNNIDSHGLIVGSLLSQAAGKLLNRNAEEIAFNATFLEALLGAAAIESDAQKQLACRLRSQYPDLVDAAEGGLLALEINGIVDTFNLSFFVGNQASAAAAAGGGSLALSGAAVVGAGLGGVWAGNLLDDLISDHLLEGQTLGDFVFEKFNPEFAMPRGPEDRCECP